MKNDKMFKHWLVAYNDPGKSDFVLTTTLDVSHQAIVDYLDPEWKHEPIIIRLYGTYEEIRSVLPGHRVRNGVGVIPMPDSTK